MKIKMSEEPEDFEGNWPEPTPTKRWWTDADELLLDSARDILIKSSIRVEGNEDAILRLMKAVPQQAELITMNAATTVKTEGLTGLMGECAAYRTEYTIFHDALKRLIDASALGDPTQQEHAFEHAREMLRRKSLC